LHIAQPMPLPLNTVSCFSKVQIGFTFLVPAHLGSPGQRTVKPVCMCLDQSRQSAKTKSKVPADARESQLSADDGGVEEIPAVIADGAPARLSVDEHVAVAVTLAARQPDVVRCRSICRLTCVHTHILLVQMHTRAVLGLNIWSPGPFRLLFPFPPLPLPYHIISYQGFVVRPLLREPRP